VILAYPEVSKNSNGETISSGGIESRIRRWKIDYKKELKTGQHINVTYGGSISCLGDAIDKELRIRVLDHVAKGVPINDIILKALAKKLSLLENNKEHLLTDNGGHITLGKVWCQRFWKRNELSSRVPTSKMREIPTDLEQKNWKYESILSYLLD